jgi:hypothetical protein
MQCYALVSLAIKAIYGPFRQAKFCDFEAKPAVLSIKRRWMICCNRLPIFINETDYMNVATFVRATPAAWPVFAQTLSMLTVSVGRLGRRLFD